MNEAIRRLKPAEDYHPRISAAFGSAVINNKPGEETLAFQPVLCALGKFIIQKIRMVPATLHWSDVHLIAYSKRWDTTALMGGYFSTRYNKNPQDYLTEIESRFSTFVSNPESPTGLFSVISTLVKEVSNEATFNQFVSDFETKSLPQKYLYAVRTLNRLDKIIKSRELLDCATREQNPAKKLAFLLRVCANQFHTLKQSEIQFLESTYNACDNNNEAITNTNQSIAASMLSQTIIPLQNSCQSELTQALHIANELKISVFNAYLNFCSGSLPIDTDAMYKVIDSALTAIQSKPKELHLCVKTMQKIRNFIGTLETPDTYSWLTAQLDTTIALFADMANKFTEAHDAILRNSQTITLLVKALQRIPSAAEQELMHQTKQLISSREATSTVKKVCYEQHEKRFDEIQCIINEQTKKFWEYNTKITLASETPYQINYRFLARVKDQFQLLRNELNAIQQDLHRLNENITQTDRHFATVENQMNQCRTESDNAIQQIFSIMMTALKNTWFPQKILHANTAYEEHIKRCLVSILKTTYRIIELEAQKRNVESSNILLPHAVKREPPQSSSDNSIEGRRVRALHIRPDDEPTDMMAQDSQEITASLSFWSFQRLNPPSGPNVGVETSRQPLNY